MPSDDLRNSNEPPRRDRRAGEHDAARAREQRRAQEVGDRERRGVDLVALAAVAALDPRDGVDLVGRDRAARRLLRGVLDAVDRRDVRGDRAQREVAAPLGFGLVVDRLAQAVLPVRVHPVLEPVERLAQHRQHLEHAFVRRDRVLVARHARERLLQPPHPLVELGVVRRRDRVGAVQLAHHPVHRRRRERRGQRGRRVLLGLVRFVEDRRNRRPAAARRRWRDRGRTARG